MIRVRYNDGTVDEYKSIKEAQFMISTILFSTNGLVQPEEAVEVIGHTTGGVIVERVLTVKLGVVELA